MDDQVISQTDIIQQGDVAPERSSSNASFTTLLERYRDERGWSKADLAKRASLDPSSITRFEQGSRSPDREMVLVLAKAMALPLVERDRLLAAAGFRSDLWDDPLLVELTNYLSDRDIPIADREEVRSILKAALAYGQLRQIESR